mmetsp:Transcript_13708/g.29274  ORF Transcript_13708/g.29274 Transcript_13708/m.29274 type:complete len:262 (-) Transcript_13708:275-1060(-)
MEGQETLDAVKSGYVTYSFEAAPAHCNLTRGRLLAEGLLVYDVKLRRDGQLEEPLPAPPADGVTGICYLFCVAAGAAHSWQTFYISKRLQHGSSFHDKLWDAEEQEVQVVPIVDYLPHNKQIMFLKSDTQGHEMEVLKGAQPLFARNQVRMLGVEFWPIGLRKANSSPEELLRYISYTLGLACFDLGVTDKFHNQEGEAYLEEIKKIPGKGRWGFYNDLVCIEPLMGHHAGGRRPQLMSKWRKSAKSRPSSQRASGVGRLQ